MEQQTLIHVGDHLLDGPCPACLVRDCRSALEVSDETAKAATPGPWRHEWSNMCRNTIEADDDEAAVASTRAPWAMPEDDFTRETNNAAHIAANDPATRLALNAGYRRWLDSIEATLAEHLNVDPARPVCRGHNFSQYAPCEVERRATADLAAVAHALGVPTG